MICLIRNLVGKINQRFEERGYKLVALKMMTASKAHLEVVFFWREVVRSIDINCVSILLYPPLSHL